MITNYMKVNFNNLLKHKRHSVINIVGLAVGLAGCLLIFLYVIFEPVTNSSMKIQTGSTAFPAISPQAASARPVLALRYE